MSGKKKALVLLLAVVAGLGYMVYRVATFDPNFVVMVADADQLRLKTGDHVKLIGVEVPPAVDGDVGTEAQEFIQSLALERYIRIETDAQPRRQGDNWILGYVYVRQGDREVFLNLELLRRGYGWSQPQSPNVKHQEEFSAAEAEAKAAGLGVWRPGYERPYGKRSSQRDDAALSTVFAGRQ